MERGSLALTSRPRPVVVRGAVAGMGPSLCLGLAGCAPTSVRRASSQPFLLAAVVFPQALGTRQAPGARPGAACACGARSAARPAAATPVEARGVSGRWAGARRLRFEERTGAAANKRAGSMPTPTSHCYGEGGLGARVRAPPSLWWRQASFQPCFIGFLRGPSICLGFLPQGAHDLCSNP